MTKKELIENKNIWAVIGATTDIEKYGYKIFKRLKNLNFEVYGISPKYTNLDGDTLYKDLDTLPKKPDVVVFVVNPKFGIDYLTKCIKIGIKNIWLQPGTVSEEILNKAKENNINVIEDCVLVQTNNYEINEH